MSSGILERRPPSEWRPLILLISALVCAFSAACSLPFNSDLYDLASRKAVTHVAGVSLNATALSIGYAATIQMTATVTPANATNKNVTWSSSNTSLATVSSTGLVTAASTPGTVDIIVTTEEGGFTASCIFTVVSVVPVTGVTMSPKTLALFTGQTSPLTATVAPPTATTPGVTWSSSNPAVATVSTSGGVTAVAVGNATITVKTTDGGFTDTCAVTISLGVPVTGVSLNTATLILLPGETSTLSATVAPSTATDQSVTWSSNNAAAATVSPGGLVTGVASGTASITVTTVDGSFTATCTVTVPSWQAPAGGGQSSGGSAYSGAVMALDSTGIPSIAFRNASGAGVVEKFAGGAWSMVGGATFANPITVNTTDANIALAFDSSDNPYVAFQDGINANRVTVMAFTAGSWTTVGSAGISIGAAKYISLAVDGTTPYVSYMDAGGTIRVDALCVMSYNGSSWTAVGTTQSSNPYSGYTSLLMRGGSPFVAYGNSSSFNPEVLNAPITTVIGGGAFAGGWTGHYITMAMDPATSFLYVAFQDSGQGNRASVWKYNNVSWSEIGAGISAGTASYTSVAFAPDRASMWRSRMRQTATGPPS